jgi:hypothetical protein
MVHVGIAAIQLHVHVTWALKPSNLSKLKQLDKFIIKLSNIKFYENPCSGPPVIVHTHRMTDGATLVVLYVAAISLRNGKM